MSSNDIDWNDVIKKEARGIDDEDFEEVKDIQGNYIVVQRGIIDEEQFYIPKDQAESYDGNILNFRLSESDLSKYQDELFTQNLEKNINKLEEEITSPEENEEYK